MIDEALIKWLKAYALTNYIDKLVEAGMDDIRDVPDLEDDDIDELIEEAKLPKLKRKKLKRAIGDVKSGKYKVEEKEFCECIQSLYSM